MTPPLPAQFHDRPGSVKLARSPWALGSGSYILHLEARLKPISAFQTGRSEAALLPPDVALPLKKLKYGGLRRLFQLSSCIAATLAKRMNVNRAFECGDRL